jgi:predicted CoA-binding protein
MKDMHKKMDSDPHSDSQIKEIYQLKNIAVVGVSKNEEKHLIRYPNILLNMATMLFQ